MVKKRANLGVTFELRKLMHSVPFAPFRIKTTDGDTFTVDHPDFVMISRRGDMAILYPKGDDGHQMLNLRQVVSMEPIVNGAKKPAKR